MSAGDDETRTARSLAWQRIPAGVLAAAGVAGVIQALASDAVDSWVDAVLLAGATYGLYVFARYALAGALPAGMQGRKAD